MDRRAIDTVRSYYDSAPEMEWDRLDQNPFEFELTTHMMDRYIRPGQTILDIGGGPGRSPSTTPKRGALSPWRS